MSLKVFHLIFINCSLILVAGFSFWLFQMAQETRQSIYLVGGWGAAATAGGLAVYFYSIIRKLKNIQ
jgi:hypothetical protein